MIFCDDMKCPEMDSVERIPPTQCSCRPHCAVWGNCCYDFHDFHPRHETMEKLREATRCVKYDALTPGYWKPIMVDHPTPFQALGPLSVIASCPVGTDPAIEEVCRGSMEMTNTLRGLFQQVPIHHDGLLYRNKACLYCQGKTFTVSRQIGSQFITSDTTWISCDGWQLSKGDSIPLDVIYMVNACGVGFTLNTLRSVSACRNDPCVNTDQSDRFSSYSSLCRKYLSVIMNNNIFYANPFCAECAGRGKMNHSLGCSTNRIERPGLFRWMSFSQTKNYNKILPIRIVRGWNHVKVLDPTRTFTLRIIFNSVVTGLRDENYKLRAKYRHAEDVFSARFTQPLKAELAKYGAIFDDSKLQTRSTTLCDVVSCIKHDLKLRTIIVRHPHLINGRVHRVEVVVKMMLMRNIYKSALSVLTSLGRIMNGRNFALVKLEASLSKNNNSLPCTFGFSQSLQRVDFVVRLDDQTYVELRNGKYYKANSDYVSLSHRLVDHESTPEESLLLCVTDLTDIHYWMFELNYYISLLSTVAIMYICVVLIFRTNVRHIEDKISNFSVRQRLHDLPLTL